MNEFAEHLNEVFAEFGQVKLKRMFGGYGVYHNGIMFALVVDGQLYLKADDTTKNDFIEKSLPAFEYQRENKTIKMSYYRAPDDIMDDYQQAAIWARNAFDVAKRTYRPRKKKKR